MRMFGDDRRPQRPSRRSNWRSAAPRSGRPLNEHRENRKPAKPKGPATFTPRLPTSRKQWKAKYGATLMRLGRLLSRYAPDLAAMDLEQLFAAAEALTRKMNNRRGKAIRLVHRLERLREQRPALYGS